MQYTPEMLDLLIPAVEKKTLPPRDRLGLENDLFALVGKNRGQKFHLSAHNYE